jgi:hypothetical protein
MLGSVAWSATDFAQELTGADAFVERTDGSAPDARQVPSAAADAPLVRHAVGDVAGRES